LLKIILKIVLAKKMIQKIRENIFAVSVIVICLAVLGVAFYVGNSRCPGLFNPQNKTISSAEASDKVISYVNNILGGTVTASFVAVSEKSSVYEVKFSIQEKEYSAFLTKDGKLFFPEGVEVTEEDSQTPAVNPQGTTIGNFSVSNEEVCKENGKPVIYYFGSTSCPHCAWEEPILDKVAAQFGAEILIKKSVDTQDNMDVFQKYSTGGIPTLVLGCKYYRIGSGENSGEEQEEKNLTALFCKLTGSNPSGVCSGVQDLISQINN
jgi:thiol-disulfide isomerase/thioredoxin